MLIIPDSNRSDGYGETSFRDQDLTAPDGRIVRNKSIIDQANMIPFGPILQASGIQADQYNHIIRCPFHAGGNERTSSLWFYFDSNRFYCFGCKKHGKPCDFVALQKNCTRLDAAHFIIEHFGAMLDREVKYTEQKSSLSNELILTFSGMLRRFIKLNGAAPPAVEYAEKVAFAFDRVMSRHNLTQDGIVSLIDKLKIKLEKF